MKYSKLEIQKNKNFNYKIESQEIYIYMANEVTYVFGIYIQI